MCPVSINHQESGTWELGGDQEYVRDHGCVFSLLPSSLVYGLFRRTKAQHRRLIYFIMISSDE